MQTGPQTYSAGARVRQRDPGAAPLAGFASRKLTAFFNLGPGDVRNLSFLYFATFIMRAAAFAGVAVMQHVMYPDPRDALWRGLPLPGLSPPAVADAVVLAVGGLGVTVSVIMVQFLVQETPFTPDLQRGTIDLLRTVLRNKDIQRLLPVYIPVVALYGYVLTFTDNLLGAGNQGSATTNQLLIVVASLGIPLGLSLAVSGRLSDRARLLFTREPLKTPRTAVAPESPIPPETR